MLKRAALAVAVVLLFVVGFRVARTKADVPREPAIHFAATRAASTSVAPLPAVAEEADDVPAHEIRTQTTERLLLALDEEDPAVRVEAIDALIERRHVDAIPRLARMSLSDPFVAPSIIVALGTLGEATDDIGQKRVALDRLLALLAQEKKRNAPDSAGNVLTIIEAIGAVRLLDGAPPLERELHDPFFDMAGQTTIVQALALIGSPSSAPPLAELRTRVSTMAPSEEAFDESIRGELLAMLDRTISDLGRR